MLLIFYAKKASKQKNYRFTSDITLNYNPKLRIKFYFSKDIKVLI